MQDKPITKVQELVYEMKVKQVMAENLITVRPETPMSQLREIFRQKRISGMPVVEGDYLVGIVSLEDFIKWLYDREEESLIESKMTRQVECLYDDEPLVHAISKFERTGYGRFTVIDRRSGKLVGVITKGDIIAGLLEKLEIEYHEEEIHRYRASHIFEDIVADRTRLVFEYDVLGQDFEGAGECSSRLKRTLGRLGLDPATVRRVAIASYEAEMNLVVFTKGGRIVARVEPGCITMEVKDSGPGIADVKKALQPGYSTAPQWVRDLGFGAGMGLNNIQKCADEMQITSTLGKGTHLKISILTGDDSGAKGNSRAARSHRSHGQEES
ncbi:MAG: CBS domain-containing protein [Gemmatimonadota bacterium]|nr:MAG: CBS domain-containing protein [Gemmatimonadota bacterium]